MSQETNPQSQADIQTLVSRAADRFMENHRCSLVIDRLPDFALISTPGMTWPEVRKHLLACLLSAGLWVPVFAMISILRAPKMYLIFSPDGVTVWTQEFDPNE